MATVSVVRSDQLVDIAGYTGASLTTTNADGDPVAFQGSGDRTIQIIGTFGVGGSIQLEGSNDGTTWAILSDPQGNYFVNTAAAMEVVEECPLFVRQMGTAGDVTTSLTSIFAVLRK